MTAFIARRLLVAIPTMLLIVVLSFVIITSAPGGPFTPEEGEFIDPEILANLRAAYNLDAPLHQQLWLYLQNLLQGELGPSFIYKGRNVAEIIATGFPVTLQLGLAATVLALFFGLGFGMIAAARRGSMFDHAIMALAMSGIAIPTFVTAPFLALVFGLYLKLLPIAGWNDGALANMVLPVVAIALPEIGVLARVTRGAMLEVLRANHVRTARAKGLPEHVVILRHALRGALVPIVSYLGPAIAGILTGSVVIEQIFGLPGIGRAFVEGSLNRDYPVVMGITILYAAIIIFMNLAADLSYRFLDPRVKQQT